MLHIIRLREPWQADWHEPAPGGMRLAVYRRRFHRPTGLQPDQAVNLVFKWNARQTVSPRVLLNKQGLTLEGQASETQSLETQTLNISRVRVDHLLEASNLLEVQFEFPWPDRERPAMGDLAEIELELQS